MFAIRGAVRRRRPDAVNAVGTGVAQWWLEVAVVSTWPQLPSVAKSLLQLTAAARSMPAPLVSAARGAIRRLRAAGRRCLHGPAAAGGDGDQLQHIAGDAGRGQDDAIAADGRCARDEPAPAWFSSCWR